jgi:hypothetical protein
MHPFIIDSRATVSLRAVDLTVPYHKPTLYAWLALHIIGGQVLLPLLCATFVLSRVKRHPVFLNACATWIITSILACLVFYGASNLYDHPEAAPHNPLCLVQASFHHAIPPMVSLSAFALIYHVCMTYLLGLALTDSMLLAQVWTLVDASRQGSESIAKLSSSMTSLRTAALLCAPYLGFAIFGLVASVVRGSLPCSLCDSIELVALRMSSNNENHPLLLSTWSCTAN